LKVFEFYTNVLEFEGVKSKISQTLGSKIQILGSNKNTRSNKIQNKHKNTRLNKNKKELAKHFYHGISSFRWVKYQISNHS